MGTPTNTKKPKPKPGQPAGKDAAAKTAAQPKNSATGSSAKATGSGVVVKPAARTQSAQPPVPQTNKRDQKREARREEITRKLEERRKEREAQMRKQRTKNWLVGGSIAAVAVALVAFFIYQVFIVTANEPPYVKGDPIAGIKCDVGEQGNTHFHAHLDIYINGQSVTVDPDIGRKDPTCFYWLHTHDTDGVVHVEAPSNGTYTLGQFFQIWGKTLSATNLMDNKVDASHQLTMYVYTPDNGTLQQDAQGNITVTPPSDLKPYTGDPTKIQLQPHELIVLEYGTPVVPPKAYTFLGGE